MSESNLLASSQQKVFYFSTPLGCNWVKATAEDEARKYLLEHSKLTSANLISLDELIRKMAEKKWIVTVRNENGIKFSRVVKGFNDTVLYVLLGISSFTSIANFARPTTMSMGGRIASLILGSICPPFLYSLIMGKTKEEHIEFPLS